MQALPNSVFYFLSQIPHPNQGVLAESQEDKKRATVSFPPGNVLHYFSSTGK